MRWRAGPLAASERPVGGEREREIPLARHQSSKKVVEKPLYFSGVRGLPALQLPKEAYPAGSRMRAVSC